MLLHLNCCCNSGRHLPISWLFTPGMPICAQVDCDLLADLNLPPPPGPPLFSFGVSTPRNATTFASSSSSSSSSNSSSQHRRRLQLSLGQEAVSFTRGTSKVKVNRAYGPLHSLLEFRGGRGAQLPWHGYRPAWGGRLLQQEGAHTVPERVDLAYGFPAVRAALRT